MKPSIARAFHVIAVTIGVMLGSILSQWMQETPDYATAIERGYFSSIMVLVCYWYFKWTGWINN